jgi:dolichyl-phosphate beta-glucosyltransferase
MQISVVIPAYNEEKNIRLGALDKVARYLEQQTYSWEVIIVDDGSSDMTKRLLEEFSEKIRNIKFFTTLTKEKQQLLFQVY